MFGSNLKLSKIIYGKVNIHAKAYNPYLINIPMRAPIFDWYVIWYGFKNIYQKDMYIRKIGLDTQDMLTIIG